MNRGHAGGKTTEIKLLRQAWHVAVSRPPTVYLKFLLCIKCWQNRSFNLNLFNAFATCDVKESRSSMKRSRYVYAPGIKVRFTEGLQVVKRANICASGSTRGAHVFEVGKTRARRLLSTLALMSVQYEPFLLGWAEYWEDILAHAVPFSKAGGVNRPHCLFFSTFAPGNVECRKTEEKTHLDVSANQLLHLGAAWRLSDVLNAMIMLW